MEIQKISNEVKEAIRAKSAFSLPDHPSARGYSPSQIRDAFYRPITDAAASLLAELDRVIEEANEAIAEAGGEPDQYIVSAEVSGGVLRLTKKDGTVVSFEGSGMPGEYIKRAVVSGGTLTLYDEDGTPVVFTPGGSPDENTVVREDDSAGNKTAVSVNGSGAASGEYSSVEGDGCEAVGKRSRAAGKNSRVLASTAFADGYACLIDALASYARASGLRNYVAAPYGSADGANNAVTGEAAHADGDSNEVAAKNARVEGNDNKIKESADNAHVEGHSNVATSPNSHTGGYQNVNNGLNAFVHGEGLRTSLKNAAVFGRYNASEHSLFVIGNGTENARHDAFVLEEYTDGFVKKIRVKIGDSGWITEDDVAALLAMIRH